jgi:NADPH:quinone reductase-like Zn-dependent oxidoreductase
MKAIVYTEYGPPGTLQLKEVEKPTPKESEVLIKVAAAAVTSTDSAARKGEKFIERLAFGLVRPKRSILGSEFSGVIEAVGTAVSRFNVGDQVYASNVDFGAHAEYLCLPEDGALVTKPANVTYQEAAGICEGGLTALSFLRDEGDIQPGQKVLINGASGAVGSYAVQLAKQFGAEVTGVCSSTHLQWVSSLGADKVIDYTKEDFTSSDQTFDLIFDAVGKRSYPQCKSSLTETGIYLTTVPTLSILLSLLWSSLFGTKKAKIAFAGLRAPSDKSKDLDFLKALVEADKIKPVLDRCYPLEQMTKAHRYVDTGHKKGNVVVTL